ncbi:hypothetical protein QQ045_005422 [Rhodiola kirilowii]
MLKRVCNDPVCTYVDARHGHRKHKESSMVVRARISFGDQMVLGSLRDQTPKFMKGVYARHERHHFDSGEDFLKQIIPKKQINSYAAFFNVKVKVKV